MNLLVRDGEQPSSGNENQFGLTENLFPWDGLTECWLGSQCDSCHYGNKMDPENEANREGSQW